MPCYVHEACLCTTQIGIRPTMVKILVAVGSLLSQRFIALNSDVAVACEVLARSVVHASPRERLASIMSSRYKFTEDDAEHPVMSSALELAIDQNWFVLHSLDPI